MAEECDKQRSSCAPTPAAPRTVVWAEADRLRALQFDHELPSRTPIHERLHLISEKGTRLRVRLAAEFTAAEHRSGVACAGDGVAVFG